MTEPAVAIEPGELAAVEGPAPSTPVSRVGDAGATDLRGVRSACLDLSVFGVWAGWMIASLGVISGAISLVPLINLGTADAAVWARLGLRALFAVLAFGAAGWGVHALSRFTAAVTLGYFELAARHWRRDFETKFRDDPESSSLKEELARARNDFVSSGLDQLKAARAVNDADRVLEIYKSIAPALDQPARSAIDSELAKWFLGLIHRRLHAGRIQADVVQLAARFAESFGGTVEGASVRASLATLRRSVGLCPRCAQPYAGVADACPNCLREVTHGPLASLLDAAPERSE